MIFFFNQAVIVLERKRQLITYALCLHAKTKWFLKKEIGQINNLWKQDLFHTNTIGKKKEYIMYKNNWFVNTRYNF